MINPSSFLVPSPKHIVPSYSSLVPPLLSRVFSSESSALCLPLESSAPRGHFSNGMTSWRHGREDHPFLNNSLRSLEGNPRIFPHCQDTPFSANRSFADSPWCQVVRGFDEGVVQTELPWIDSPSSNGALCLPTNDLSTRRNLEEKKSDGGGVDYLRAFFLYLSLQRIMI